MLCTCGLDEDLETLFRACWRVAALMGPGLLPRSGCKEAVFPHEGKLEGREAGWLEDKLEGPLF